MRVCRPSCLREPRTAATWPWGVAAQAGEGGLGVDQGFAFESSADEIDDVVGEVGDVAEGFMLDLAVLAEGSAQQMGVVGGVFELASGGGYMDGACFWKASRTNITKTGDTGNIYRLD